MSYETIEDGTEWEFRSSSNPQKRYRVILNGFVNNSERNGMLSCNCPSWVFNQKGDRTCKHTKEIMQHLLASDQIGIAIKKERMYGEV